MPDVPRPIIWLVLALLVYGGLRFLAGRAIYHPLRYPAGLWEVQQDLGAQDVWLHASDGMRLHAWWIEKQDAPLATLHLHGNGGNITHRSLPARQIAEAGSSVLLLDYRGYGKSDGRPAEAGLYQDADAAYEHLISQGYPPERIIVHGESLGTAIAVDLAARKPCAGVVLEAPFPSVKAVAARVLPLVGPLLISGFDSQSKIGKVDAPLLFVHGTADQVISYDLGKQLYDAAPEPKELLTVEGGDHNDLHIFAGTKYKETLRQFYETALRPR
ncbi:MAG: alpha/beta hydrolase [Bryobacteraceae bacterium]